MTKGISNGVKEAASYLADILEVPPKLLTDLENAMVQAGREPALERVAKENEELVEGAFKQLGRRPYTAEELWEPLFRQVAKHEQELYSLVGVSPESFDFEKIAEAARSIGTEEEGYFLKKEYAAEILKKHPPENAVQYLGYSSVEEMFSKEDVGEVFSALRFVESDRWMHKTFDVAYTNFTAKDFERRSIELRVLGPQWKEIAEKYVAKKHHNVSHLKEFGVIFLNPIAQTSPGSFLRDFALLLHYFHEVVFYSKLFERYAPLPDFNQKFISLLRGDVLERNKIQGNEWLIVQRYLWKENPQDPRLFLPRVNPEAMHWRKAEEDLVAFGKKEAKSGLEFWEKLFAAAVVLADTKGQKQRISFDLEDAAMSYNAASQGEPQRFFYHQREALWNKIAAAYAGGYEKIEQLLLEHMQQGVVSL